MTLSPPSPAFPDLERFMSEVTNRLKKLDLLDDILSRLVNMETHCQTIGITRRCTIKCLMSSGIYITGW
jgi:hypothetical protein